MVAALSAAAQRAEPEGKSRSLKGAGELCDRGGKVSLAQPFQPYNSKLSDMQDWSPNPTGEGVENA